MIDPVTAGRRREVTRLAAALDHAVAALDVLLPAGPEMLAGSGFFTRTKLAAETALLLHAASRAETDGQLTGRLRGISERLRGPARSQELLAWARLRPAIIPELSVAHRVLTAYGQPDVNFDEALDRAAATCSVAPVERLPWKQIERGWQVELGRPARPDFAAIDASATALGTRQDAIFATRDEVYGLTHALIYHTDFGHRCPPLPRALDEIVADAGSALARCLDEDDFDLGAEVLLTWPYSLTPFDPVAAFGLQVLRSIHDEIGYLPSMTLREDEYAALGEGERPAYYYKEAYHTEYVMGLLTAAILAPDVKPTPQLAECEAGVAAARRLRDQLPDRAHTPLWEESFESLTPSEQGALVPLLADVGVRRIVRSGRFSALPAFLTSAVSALADIRVPPTPAVEQGVELLSRLSSGPDPFR
jgi:hypothetical protein